MAEHVYTIAAKACHFVSKKLPWQRTRKVNNTAQNGNAAAPLASDTKRNPISHPISSAFINRPNNRALRKKYPGNVLCENSLHKTPLNTF